ncbi:MAG: hypothetical protein N3B12_09045 [Armatimonadetes bacterium]|nr:hypothetical protein [Armatimonadota bacterium]
MIKNAGISRTITAFGGPLRTTKFEVEGVQVIRHPGVEFVIDLDHNGEPISLIPSDFEVKGVDTVKVGSEMRASVRLQCIRDDIPVVIFLRYYHDPGRSYQQKSVTVEPCAKPRGAVLRRIILDEQALKPEYVPVMPKSQLQLPVGSTGDSSDQIDKSDRFVFGGHSNFAAFDRGSNRGLFFFVTSPAGKEGVGRTGNVRMWEEVWVPLSEGYETGRATVGLVKGPPEILFKRFREFLWENYCVTRGKFIGSGLNRVEWSKSDVLAGRIPEAPDSNSTRVLVLRGDEWSVTSPGASEASFAALANCVEACRRVREGDRNAVIEMTCGVVKKDHSVNVFDFVGKWCFEYVGIHWLSVVDRLVSGESPTWQTLSGRQVRYERGFLLPPAAFGADQDVSLPPDGSVSLPKEFASYLMVYQHILDFPDGRNVDGEGHVIANRGFLVFFNPANEVRKIAIPLGEPGLELKGSIKLTDWSKPEAPVSIGTASVSETVEIEIPPSGAKVIGINL